MSEGSEEPPTPVESPRISELAIESPRVERETYPDGTTVSRAYVQIDNPKRNVDFVLEDGDVCEDLERYGYYEVVVEDKNIRVDVFRVTDDFAQILKEQARLDRDSDDSPRSFMSLCSICTSPENDPNPDSTSGAGCAGKCFPAAGLDSTKASSGKPDAYAAKFFPEPNSTRASSGKPDAYAAKFFPELDSTRASSGKLETNQNGDTGLNPTGAPEMNVASDIMDGVLSPEGNGGGKFFAVTSPGAAKGGCPEMKTPNPSLDGVLSPEGNCGGKLFPAAGCCVAEGGKKHAPNIACVNTLPDLVPNRIDPLAPAVAEPGTNRVNQPDPPACARMQPGGDLLDPEEGQNFEIVVADTGCDTDKALVVYENKNTTSTAIRRGKQVTRHGVVAALLNAINAHKEKEEGNTPFAEESHLVEETEEDGAFGEVNGGGCTDSQLLIVCFTTVLVVWLAAAHRN